MSFRFGLVLLNMYFFLSLRKRLLFVSKIDNIAQKRFPVITLRQSKKLRESNRGGVSK